MYDITDLPALLNGLNSCTPFTSAVSGIVRQCLSFSTLKAAYEGGEKRVTLTGFIVSVQNDKISGNEENEVYQRTNDLNIYTLCLIVFFRHIYNVTYEYQNHYFLYNVSYTD